MNQFAVVTDSAADIPLALAEKWGIHVVPLHVVFQGTDYRDGVDITTPELLKMMDGAEALPVTSQPTPADFLEVYKQLFTEGYREVLSIHLSRALSSTIESARGIAPPFPIRRESAQHCAALP